MKDAGSAKFVERWDVRIVCRDCGTIYRFMNPSIGAKMMSGGKRCILVEAPEVCPNCRNLRPVPPKPPAFVKRLEPPKKAS